MKKLWVLFPLYNRFDNANGFIQKLDSFKLSYEVEVVVVDHGDKEYSVVPVNNISVTVLRASPLVWWTGAINFGLRRIKELADSEDILLLINDDVLFEREYFDNIGKYHFDEHEFVGSVNLDEASDKVIQMGYGFNVLRGLFVAQGNGLELSEIPNELFCKTLSGRGVLGLCVSFFGLGFFAENKLPHYGADFAYFWAGRKAGYRLKVSKLFVLRTKFVSYQKAKLFQRLWSKRQPGNLPMLFRLSKMIFPIWYGPYFLLVSALQTIIFSIRK